MKIRKWPIVFSNGSHQFSLWSFPDPVPGALGKHNNVARSAKDLFCVRIPESITEIGSAQKGRAGFAPPLTLRP